jgi:hypothetical protein
MKVWMIVNRNKVWMIVNRNGNPYYSYDGYGFTGRTRKAAIDSLCGPDAYMGNTVADVWDSWQRQGYDCVRVSLNAACAAKEAMEAKSDE